MDTNKYVRWVNVDDAHYLAALNEEFNEVIITKEEIENSLENTKELIAVAILDEQPVGFACAQYFKSFCYRDAQGEITEMYIRPSARGNGFSSLLLAFLEQRLKEYGVTTVKILTGKDNKIAQKAYERLNYYKEDELVLQKDLS